MEHAETFLNLGNPQDANKSVEEKTMKLEEARSRLSSADERVRQVQELADERMRELDGLKAQCETYKRDKIELQMEIGDLKQEKIGNSIQLQYKEKKLEQVEAALKELQSKASSNVV